MLRNFLCLNSSEKENVNGEWVHFQNSSGKENVNGEWVHFQNSSGKENVNGEWIYSRLLLSRLRLSRITAYLEEKILSLL